MPTDTLPMDANMTLPIIPASIILMVADTTPPVIPTDTLPMDTDTTLPVVPASMILMIANTTLTPTLPTGTTPMDADTIPTPAVPTDGNTPGSFPLSGEGTMVLYKQPFAPESASAMNLEAQIRGKDVIIAEQAQLLSQLRQGLEEVKEQTITQSLALAQVGKDTMIAQQSEEQQDQEQLEAPAPEMLVPAAPNLNNHVLQGVNDDPPQTSSMSSRRGQWKMQGSPECSGVSSQIAKAFAEGTGPGPNPLQLRWDFNRPASSPWNQAVISQLMCLLVDMRWKWTTEGQTDEYWVAKITQKFTQIKKCVERVKPHVHDNLSVETGVEVAMRLANEKDEALKKARRDTWQQTEITKSMVAVKEVKGDDDIVAWWFLNSLITTLGSDGMSSEDSDGEDTEAIFCTRTLLWRRDIVRELQIIDQQRLRDSTIFSPRGAKAAKQIRGNNFPQSEWKVVKGLPHPFYNEGWLAQNKGMSSDEPFCWMMIYVQS
ncbi:hypothetical protein PISMIDRAFT_24750 [Pisolithus microcarpus 441]|uniref:Uncharacterized protein n=1 Tax=Pisolithus microcarpus 441 TaxID=765257 RepID=A0A0C9Z6R9_9AGAM|nr:hypothetical protein BKA83DRAFT_24750 [Pisolithus microcarpus]KIK18122.1 hypothetical protein PISMIDRAFT_24750 [Pisolithus microcarpus 441]